MKAMMFVTGAMTVNLIGLGDELGFYQALKANGGPMTSSELAKATGTHERWTREWLHQQVGCSLTIGAISAFYGIMQQLALWACQCRAVRARSPVVDMCCMTASAMMTMTDPCPAGMSRIELLMKLGCCTCRSLAVEWQHSWLDSSLSGLLQARCCSLVADTCSLVTGSSGLHHGG